MKSVMSLTIVLAAAFGAAAPAPAAAQSAVLTLQPVLSYPSINPCWERGVELKRRDVDPDLPCPDIDPINPRPRPLPYPFPRPNPRPWDDADSDMLRGGFVKSAARLDAVRGANADALLAGLFDGGAVRRDESSAVAATATQGRVVFAHTDPSMPNPLEKKKKGSVVPAIAKADGSGARIVLVGESGAAATVAGAVVHEIVRSAVEKANEAAERYVNRDQTQESIEKYGGCRMKGTCDK